jgi:hypothetical protein
VTLTAALIYTAGLVRETATSKEPARLYLCFLYLTVITWAGACQTGNRGVSERQSPPLPKWRLARVDEYISLQMDERVRLADLAELAGLSRTHFAAQLPGSVGMPPRPARTRVLLRPRQRDRRTCSLGGQCLT